MFLPSMFISWDDGDDYKTKTTLILTKTSAAVILPSSAFVQISAASFRKHQIQHSQAFNSSKTVRCHCNSKDRLTSGCYSKMDKILGKSQIQKPCNFVLSQNDTRQQIHHLTSIFSSHKITKLGIRDTTSTAYFCRSSFAATCARPYLHKVKNRETRSNACS